MVPIVYTINCVPRLNIYILLLIVYAYQLRLLHLMSSELVGIDGRTRCMLAMFVFALPALCSSGFLKFHHFVFEKNNIGNAPRRL